MSSNTYNTRPNVAMDMTNHEIAPMGEIYECTTCDEIFYTHDAAMSHQQDMASMH